jgi:hypothetical protein
MKIILLVVLHNKQNRLQHMIMLQQNETSWLNAFFTLQKIYVNKQNLGIFRILEFSGVCIFGLRCADLKVGKMSIMFF